MDEQANDGRRGRALDAIRRVVEHDEGDGRDTADGILVLGPEARLANAPPLRLRPEDIVPETRTLSATVAALVAAELERPEAADRIRRIVRTEIRAAGFAPGRPSA